MTDRTRVPPRTPPHHHYYAPPMTATTHTVTDGAPAADPRACTSISCRRGLRLGLLEPCEACAQEDQSVPDMTAEETP